MRPIGGSLTKHLIYYVKYGGSTTSVTDRTGGDTSYTILIDRFARTVFNGPHSHLWSFNTGVPQGSHLSSLVSRFYK